MLEREAEVGPPLGRVVVELDGLVVLLLGFSDEGPARQRAIAIAQSDDGAPWTGARRRTRTYSKARSALSGTDSVPRRAQGAIHYLVT